MEKLLRSTNHPEKVLVLPRTNSEMTCSHYRCYPSRLVQNNSGLTPKALNDRHVFYIQLTLIFIPGVN